MNRYDRSTVRTPEALTPSCVPVTRKQLAEPQVARVAGAIVRTPRSTTPPRATFRSVSMRVSPGPPGAEDRALAGAADNRLSICCSLDVDSRPTRETTWVEGRAGQ